MPRKKIKNLSRGGFGLLNDVEIPFFPFLVVTFSVMFVLIRIFIRPGNYFAKAPAIFKICGSMTTPPFWLPHRSNGKVKTFALLLSENEKSCSCSL